MKRFYDHLPEETRPQISTSNAEELLFSRLDSGYIVSVASDGGSGAGRSATAQLLHASEAAFWSDLPIQMASLMQIVPDLPETEIIIESTAKPITANMLVRLLLAHGVTAAKIIRTQTAQESPPPRFGT